MIGKEIASAKGRKPLVRVDMMRIGYCDEAILEDGSIGFRNTLIILWFVYADKSEYELKIPCELDDDPLSVYRAVYNLLATELGENSKRIINPLSHLLSKAELALMRRERGNRSWKKEVADYDIIEDMDDNDIPDHNPEFSPSTF